MRGQIRAGVGVLEAGSQLLLAGELRRHNILGGLAVPSPF